VLILFYLFINENATLPPLESQVRESSSFQSVSSAFMICPFHAKANTPQVDNVLVLVVNLLPAGMQTSRAHISP
jgi:hypothetical protein